MRQQFAEGIVWGEAKLQLFELINGQLAEARDKYDSLLANPAHIEEVLQQGAAKARAYSQPLLEKVREAVGIRKIK
jgi:tryptophanyl-tRNA synthetase